MNGLIVILSIFYQVLNDLRIKYVFVNDNYFINKSTIEINQSINLIVSLNFLWFAFLYLHLSIIGWGDRFLDYEGLISLVMFQTFFHWLIIFSWYVICLLMSMCHRVRVIFWVGFLLLLIPKANSGMFQLRAFSLVILFQLRAFSLFILIVVEDFVFWLKIPWYFESFGIF